MRKLDCPLPEALSIKEATVLSQFGDLLRQINLPEQWRETIAARVSQEHAEDEQTAHLEQRRLELEAEQRRLVTAFAKGYLTEEELDAEARSSARGVVRAPHSRRANHPERSPRGACDRGNHRRSRQLLE